LFQRPPQSHTKYSPHGPGGNPVLAAGVGELPKPVINQPHGAQTKTWEITMKKLILAAAVLAVSAPLAFAQEAAKAPDFAAVDADKSGTVSMEEAKAAITTLTDDAYKAADADGSGDLNADEFAKLAAG
jgi:EF hand